MKHFVAYSAPRNGHDREGAWLSRRELEQTYLPPFQAAVDAGVQSAMESYQEVNGEPVVGSAALLQGLLRERSWRPWSRQCEHRVTDQCES